MKHQNSTRLFNYRLFFFVIVWVVFMWENFTVKSTTVLAQEISPKISQELIVLKESQKRWIEIDLSTQSLTAWEGSQPIQTITVSTGKKSTPTISGVFTIQSKRPIDRMRGADYDVPNVPHAMYYHRGYAIHGAYWHNKFGTPVSHGCVNLELDHAEWLFNWTSVGTSVVIHE